MSNMDQGVLRPIRAAFKLNSAKADISAGIVAAAVSLPQTVPMGVIAFAPLGPDWVWLGVQSSLIASIVAGLVAALFTGAPLMINGPRAAGAVVLAALVANLASDPLVAANGGAPLAVTLTFAAILLSGVVQFFFGAFRLGRLIKFIPYPVVAGFINGVAAVIILGQINPILGLPMDFKWAERWPEAWGLAQPGAAMIALAAAAAMVISNRLTKVVPAALVGLAGGVAAYALSLPHASVEALGGVVGALPPLVPMPTALFDMLSLPADGWVIDKMVSLLPSIVVLALINSIDSLLAAVGIDMMTDGRHDSDRELIAQGASNMASACFGGVVSAGSLSRTAASVGAGARTRLAGVVACLLTLLLVVVAADSLAWLPIAALAGMLALMTWDMFDAWTIRMVRAVAKPGAQRHDKLANLAVVLSVAAVTVLVNLLVAVGLGLALSMLLFIRRMSRPIIRRVSDGRTRRSLKVRSRTEAETLALYGGEILVIELDGPLFFGTADALLVDVLARAEGVRVIILDMRRVREMDATGARILSQLARELRKRGPALVLSHLEPDDAMGRQLAEIGGAALFEQARPFHDTDRALEWAEEEILHRHDVKPGEERVLDLAELPVAAGMTENDITFLAGSMVRRELPAGAVLFREGDPGDSMYILAKGAVTIRLHRDGMPPLRLATFLPGVSFGEMSLLEGQPRSAEAVADNEVVVYVLDVDCFQALVEEHPEVSNKLMLNIAREMAARLRVTSAQVRAGG